MSFFALVSGTLAADPQARISSNGKPYAIGTIREDDLFVSWIAFGAFAEQLLDFSKGSVVSVAGRARLSSWTGKDGAEHHGLSITLAQIIGMEPRKPQQRKPSGTRKRAVAFLAPSSQVPDDRIDGLWGPAP